MGLFKKALSAALCCGLLFACMTTAFAAGGKDPKQAMTQETYTDQNGTVLRYRFYLPENYDETKEYPLVLLLHGAGERGSDNTAQIQSQSVSFAYRLLSEEGLQNECMIVAPQCANGYQWCDATFWGGSYSVDETPESVMMKAVVELLKSLQEEYSINERRLYVTGLSMGGYGTWDIIARHPELFAAAIPICGAGDPTKADVMKDVAIRIYHGDQDGSVPVTGSRDMAKALEAAGGNFRYTEYPGVGHDSWNRAYQEADLLTWMFAQEKPLPVDKSALTEAIEQAESIYTAAELQKYTAATVAAYQTALEAAKEAAGDDNATQVEVDERVIELEGAITGLAKLPVDKSALTEAIAQAESIYTAAELQKYTAATVAAYQTALEAAKEAAGDDNATQVEVDERVIELEGAITGLAKLPVDKSALLDAIERAEKTYSQEELKKYTQETAKAYSAALAAARQAAAAQDAEQEQVDTRLQALVDAIAALEEIFVPGPAQDPVPNTGAPSPMIGFLLLAASAACGGVLLKKRARA